MEHLKHVLSLEHVLPQMPSRNILFYLSFTWLIYILCVVQQYPTKYKEAEKCIANKQISSLFSEKPQGFFLKGFVWGFFIFIYRHKIFELQEHIYHTISCTPKLIVSQQSLSAQECANSYDQNKIIRLYLHKK